MTRGVPVARRDRRRLIESMDSVVLPVVMNVLKALYYLCDFATRLDALVRHNSSPTDELLSYDAAHATQIKALETIANVVALSRVSVVTTGHGLTRTIVRETS